MYCTHYMTVIHLSLPLLWVFLPTMTELYVGSNLNIPYHTRSNEGSVIHL